MKIVVKAITHMGETFLSVTATTTKPLSPTARSVIRGAKLKETPVKRFKKLKIQGKRQLKKFQQPSPPKVRQEWSWEVHGATPNIAKQTFAEQYMRLREALGGALSGMVLVTNVDGLARCISERVGISDAKYRTKKHR